MTKIDQEELMKIIDNESDTKYVIIKTPGCHKCQALMNKIDNEGNSKGVVYYEFNAKDKDAITFMQSNAIQAVPVTVKVKGSKDYDLIRDELFQDVWPKL